MRNTGFGVLTIGAVCLALVMPAYGQGNETLEEAQAATKLVHDWVNGNLSDYNMPEITYSGDPITLRFSTHTPATASSARLVEGPAFKLLERLTNGKITVEARHGGTVHAAKEGIVALRNGLTDMTFCFTSYTPTLFNLTHGMSLPGVFDTEAAATQAGQELAAKYFVQEYKPHGIYLGYMRATTPYIYFSNNPVRELEDIQNKKIRSSGGAHALVQEALGGVPTSVTSPNIYTAMQRGVIDMISLTDAIIKVFNLHEVTKYRTYVNVTRLNFERCISKRWYDGLPGDLQEVMNRFVPVMAQAESQILYRLAGAQAREVFKKAGMESITLSKEEEARWQKAASPLIEEFIAENEAEGRPARELVNDMRALNEKYGAMSANELTRMAIDNPSSALAAHW